MLYAEAGEILVEVGLLEPPLGDPSPHHPEAVCPHTNGPLRGEGSPRGT